MITAKQKRSPVRLIVILVILGLIVGGIATVIIQQESGNASVSPDFTMALHFGTTDDPTTWSNITETQTILNGTNGLNNQGTKLIVSIGSQGTFNSFVRLNVTGLPSGITFSFRPVVLRTVGAGTASSALTFKAAPNVTSQASSYNVTVTAQSTSPPIVHSVSFSLKVRATKLFWGPSVLSVAKGEKFTLRLLLSDAYNVTSFQFTGNFNSTLIQALTNGTRFNPDFNRFGKTVGNDSPCQWVDNVTGTLGTCAMGGSILGQCVSAPCITVNATQTYNLLNQTFVANTNYNGFTPVTVSQDIVVEAVGQNVALDPHRAAGGIITVAEIAHGATFASKNVSNTGPDEFVSLLILLPLLFLTYRRKSSRRIVK